VKTLARRLLIDRSKPITVALIVLATIGFYLGSKVSLRLSLTDLLPENHPAVVKFEKLTKVVGGVGYLTVILEAADGKSHLEIVPRLVEALRGRDLVRSVFYHREERFFVDRMLYYLTPDRLRKLEKGIDDQVTQSRRKLFDIGLFEDDPKEEPKAAFDDELTKAAARSAAISAVLDSKDRRHLLLMIKPSFDSTDMEKTLRLIAETEELLKKSLPAQVTYELTERYYTKVVETEMIQSDIFRLGALSLFLIALILLISLRTVRGLVAIFAPVLMGLGFTAGLTYLFIGHINIITGFLMGIVSGLGVDYGIHLLLRLRLERREPSSADPDPVWRTLASSGHAVFTGAMAAAFSFFLLCASDFRAFSEFGFICGVGITAVLGCLLLSFSTWVRWLGLDREVEQKIRPSRFQFPVLSVPKGLAVGSLVSVALMIVGIKVTFEYDFNKMLQHSAKLEALSNLVDDIYGRSAVPSALAVPTKDEALRVEETIKQRHMPALVKTLISGASIVPDDQEEKQRILAKIRKIVAPIKDRWLEKSLGVPASAVRTWLDAKPFTFPDLPSHIQDALRGTTQSGYLIYIYPAVKLGEYRTISQYAGMIKDLEATYPNVLTGSDAVIFSDILDLIWRDGLLILLLIFGSVGFFIWLGSRRMDDTLLSYIPLLLSLPVGLGLMALFGVKFNIFNIAIIPTFVAMGIDVPIHIVHRTHETGSGYKAARDLATSINLALMTAAVGFGVLIFARAGVLRSLGWIALLGTVAIWWVGLFILPAFLEWRSRSGARSVGVAGHEPMSGVRPREQG